MSYPDAVSKGESVSNSFIRAGGRRTTEERSRWQRAACSVQRAYRVPVRSRCRGGDEEEASIVRVSVDGFIDFKSVPGPRERIQSRGSIGAQTRPITHARLQTGCHSQRPNASPRAPASFSFVAVCGAPY
jgi:hypothetical protein